MSTMYYTLPKREPIGQTHFLGKDKGYHLTWTMYPYAFCEFATNALYNPAVVDEYGRELSLDSFAEVVVRATSQSFEEGLA